MQILLLLQGVKGKAMKCAFYVGDNLFSPLVDEMKFSPTYTQISHPKCCLTEGENFSKDFCLASLKFAKP